jgi:DNA-binding NtrC family response regulator
MRVEPESPRILIVDDDPDQRDLLETFLRRQGFRTRGAESGAAALELLGREPCALLITDVRMPGISGLETLRRVREQHPRLPVLLVTAFADVRSAVAAMRDGALNYLAKPIDLDELMASVRLAVQGGAPPPVEGAVPPLPADVVVASPLLRAVCRDAAAIAGSDSRALLSGESGAGKEVVASLIHRWSNRAAGPLVKVGCVAVPEAQLEAELFGQELPGGLVRTGRLEQAETGSLFLDEIAELPAALQSRLLRLLP